MIYGVTQKNVCYIHVFVDVIEIHSKVFVFVFVFQAFQKKVFVFVFVFLNFRSICICQQILFKVFDPKPDIYIYIYI